MVKQDGRGGYRPKSGRKLESHFGNLRVTCVSCGKDVERKDSLSDHRLKDSEGRYCRFCPECEGVFKKAVATVDDPTGLVFDEGIEVDLGDKDPFFRIRFFSDEGEMPSWKVVGLEDESGGLLVFVRRVGSFVQASKAGGKPNLTCKIIITKKSTRVAFAEPYMERPPINVAAKNKEEVNISPEDVGAVEEILDAPVETSVEEKEAEPTGAETKTE